MICGLSMITDTEIAQEPMLQDRTVRSNAPSPSSRYSKPPAASSPILLPNQPPPSKLKSRTVVMPMISYLSSPGIYPQPHVQPRASATHAPPLPVAFRWRCCRSGCLTTNKLHTSTHFTRLSHVHGLQDTVYWTPSYRLDRCSDCQHQACKICLLLEVEGQSEWKAAEAEVDFDKTGQLGIWRRIGYWGEGRRFGVVDEMKDRARDDVEQRRDMRERRRYIVKSLETADRVGQDWI